MSTLLSYGFTAIPKKAPDGKRQPIPITDSEPQPSQTSIANQSSPNLPLPPIPQNDLPEQSTAPQMPRERPQSSTGVAYRSALTNLRPRPPKAQTRPTVNPEDKFFVPPPVFRATLFPHPAGVTNALSRTPSKGLHDSDKVRHILQSKCLGGIIVDPTNINNGYIRRNSIEMTPASMYGTQGFGKPELSLDTAIPKQPLDLRLTPIEMDLGALEIIAMMPESARTSLKGSVRDSSVKTNARNLIIRSDSLTKPIPRNAVVAVELPGGSVMNVITPEQSAWQRSAYLPGAIRLEQKSKTERTPLEIIMESFNQDTSASGNAIIDELFDFIESYGKNFRVMNTGLDTFWVDSPPPMDITITERSSHGNATFIPTPPIALPIPGSPSWNHNHSEESFGQYENASEYDFPSRKFPEMRLRRASFASLQRSESSRTMLSPMSTPNSLTAHSPPLAKYPYSSSYTAASPKSPPVGLLPVPTPTSGTQRKVKQVKGKGPTQGGQKMSFRKLLSSASAIV